MVKSVTDTDIEVIIHVTKVDVYKETPRAEDIAIIYSQMTAFLQVSAEKEMKCNAKFFDPFAMNMPYAQPRVIIKFQLPTFCHRKRINFNLIKRNHATIERTFPR